MIGFPNYSCNQRCVSERGEHYHIWSMTHTYDRGGEGIFSHCQCQSCKQRQANQYTWLESFHQFSRMETQKSLPGFRVVKILTMMYSTSAFETFPLESNIVIFFSWSVPILISRSSLKEEANKWSKVLPDDKKARNALNRVAKAIKIFSETESTIMVPTSKSGMMKKKICSSQETTNPLLPAGGVKNVELHCAYLQIFKRVLKKPVFVYGNKIIEGVIDPPCAVVTLCNDSIHKVRKNSKTDELDKSKEVMKIDARKEIHQTQIDLHEQIEIEDKNPKHCI